MSRLTLIETKDREDKVKSWLDAGLTVQQIADKLGISKQSVHQFCSLRGWL